MTKYEFAELLMKNGNFKNAQEAKRQTNVFVETMKEALVQEKTLVFRGLGIFEIKETKRKNYFNPKTGEKIKCAPKKYIKFKTGKELSEKLNER